MERVPAENAKLDDGTGSQDRDHCLGTPVILRQILEHFSSTELLELSLVNKLWNFETRSVLRDRGNVTAKLGHVPRQILAHFAADLRQMQVIPFSGINLKLSPDSHHCCLTSSWNASLDLSFNVILNRLPWKHVAVEIVDDWEKFPHCPALLLLKEIINNFCGILEELSIALHSDQMQFYHKVVQGHNFPCLKTLKVKASSLEIRHPSTSLVKALVSCAPNLKEFHTEDENCLEENVLEGSSAVIVPTFPFNPLYHRVTESLIGSLRPETISVYLFPRPGTFQRRCTEKIHPNGAGGFSKSAERFSDGPSLCSAFDVLRTLL